MKEAHKHFAVSNHDGLKVSHQFNKDAQKLTEGAIALAAVATALRVI